MNPLAQELNSVLQQNSTVYSLLSQKGELIYFPKRGILGQTAEAKGKDINATIGIALEDDGSPMRLGCIETQCGVKPEEMFPYASSFGKPELREKWLSLLQIKNPVLENVSMPVITNALTHALSICGYLFLNEGDEVLVLEPFWGNYKLIFEHRYGAILKKIPLFRENKCNVQGIKEQLQKPGKKKVLLLNFPNNPTGYTITTEEVQEILQSITEAAETKQILVICDDAYFGLVYEKGVYTGSLFAKLATLHENVLAVKVDGITKEEYAWGLRVGFITFGIKGGNVDIYASLEEKAAGAIRGSISNVSHLSQTMILNGFNSESYQNEKREKFDALQRRYQKVKMVLKNNPHYAEEFAPLPFNSGYFMCIETKRDAEQIRKQLLQKYNTGVIAISPNTIRIAFSSVATPKIDILFENIFQCCKEIKTKT